MAWRCFKFISIPNYNAVCRTAPTTLGLLISIPKYNLKPNVGDMEPDLIYLFHLIILREKIFSLLFLCFLKYTLKTFEAITISSFHVTSSSKIPGKKPLHTETNGTGAHKLAEHLWINKETISWK